jgi:ribulose-phosphate 3-epimerase
VSVLIAPSIIAADYLALGDAVSAVQEGGADLLHVDVMDGHFVPNLTIGPDIVKALRRRSRLPLDVHLMIANPDRYFHHYAEAGASVLIVHVEATAHLHRLVEAIHALGLKAGVALNPATHVGSLEEIASIVDTVLVMSVDPGFSGQTFIPRSESKISAVKALLRRVDSSARVEVDGGVDATNVGRVVAAGGDIVVAGTAVFGAGSPRDGIRALREAAAQPA